MPIDTDELGRLLAIVGSTEDADGGAVGTAVVGV